MSLVGLVALSRRPGRPGLAAAFAAHDVWRLALKLRLPAGRTPAASFRVVIDGPYCAAVVLLASRARNWLSGAAIRRRLERVLGATLVCLGIDLAAATR
jgi:hypothetical protein